ncbi:putative inorganic phosphate cotransporter [Helicoverpa zea]|uniref:putative inorganic phosphate cotransporter n=1 Tax=Helicoverpa zea TaxID=7113 RepID=UPI001F5794AE|nr:putative inorganic phosphate cotransporter [Helicoverpa zea]
MILKMLIHSCPLFALCLTTRTMACCGIRHVQVFLLFTGLVTAFTMRINMSMAIVAMTSESTFDWSMQTQSVILSSFLWGYIILQIPSGMLAARYGGKLLLIMCIGINSVVSLLIPYIAHKTGWKGLCFCRFLQGLFQGGTYPATHYLVSKWIPIEEKGRCVSFVYAGAFLGMGLQLLASGFIIDMWEWPAIFYSNGILGIIWLLCYAFVGSDSPQKSKMISPAERLLIQTSLGQVGEQMTLKTPWKAILTSVPFYALLIMHSGHNWGFWTLMTEIPSYMGQILNIHIKTNGVVSSIPYFTTYALSFVFGFATDYALRHKWCSTATCRKVSNSIGEFGPAIMLIVLCQVPPGHTTACIVLLALVVGLNAGNLTGFLITHIDMAPNFAGRLMGLTNCAATGVGLIAPLVAGAILKDEKDPKQWHIVFYLASAIYIASNLIFIIFGSNKIQAWNNPAKDIS